MRSTLLLLLASATAAFAQTAPPSRHERENVAAFARLYGVVRYFYPSDAAATLDWNRFAVYGVSRVRRAPNASALETTLEDLFTPLGPGIEIAPTLGVRQAGGASDASLVAWRYRGAGISTMGGPYTMKRTNRSVAKAMAPVPPKASPPSEPFEIPMAGAFVDVDLTPRLKARVPVALSDAQAAAMSAGMSALVSAVMSVGMSAVNDSPDVRLADVVVAWNVFRHFYPYWPETGVDWDARLRSQIEAALRADGTRAAHRNVLRALVADARDGHGSVVDVGKAGVGVLPVQLRVVEGKLAVIASGAPEARVGAVVTAIDGQSAAERVATETRLSSGAPQWQPWRAMRDILTCPVGSVVKLTLEYPLDATREVSLTCKPGRMLTETRPDSIAELLPGVWYVDLTRVSKAQLEPRLATLASAKGVVFDVRGYPTDAGVFILPHLLDAAESDRWMHVSRIVGPFGQISEWDSMGWNLAPRAPRIAGKRVFLTDGRAISYAESVMGYVGDLKLATIIGGPTAGTNGNVAKFAVPGGFQIVFTGMRVTRHDGRSPHHLAGVQPDIPLEPTLVGLRGGRDELLERALAVLRDPR